MAVRIVVGLEPHADRTQVESRLKASGAEAVQVSEPSVLVATAADEVAEKVMQTARAVPGVRYVERDSFQTTF